MSTATRSEAKDRANQFSSQYGASKDYFGHKDYYAAKAGGASDADILKQLDSNPNQLRGGNVKGGGGLYDQIKSGKVPSQDGGASNNYTDNSDNRSYTDNRQDNRQDNRSYTDNRQDNRQYKQDNDTKINNQQDTNVSQKNPQQSDIQGDNNYVNQQQDNSVRVYGGDNRSFVYNSQGEGKDTPATMATLAGYYAPDDSPGAQASRLDRHVTQNRDNQKKYSNTSHIAMGAIKRGEQNSYIDPAKIDKRVRGRSEYHRAQSTVTGGNIFGDLFGMNGPTWNSAEPAKPVEMPDFEKMHETYTDF